MEDFTAGKHQDLEVIENSVNEYVDGVRKEGLSLNFQEMIEPEPEAEIEEEITFVDADDNDGKSSHTQVINLTFDPTKVLDEYSSRKNAKKKIVTLGFKTFIKNPWKYNPLRLFFSIVLVSKLKSELEWKTL